MNNKVIIKFHINDHDYLEAVIPCKLEEIYRYEEVKIFLNLQFKKYCLFEKEI